MDVQKLESQSSYVDSSLDSKCLESLNDLQHLDGLDVQSRDSLSTPNLLDSKYRESQTRGSLDSNPSESQHSFHTLSHYAYIGKGNKAYRFLNTLQADILVLTTPGLDVLHIKRQAGVKHYCHIVHSLSPMTYRVFGVDYFHSVLVANAVQRDFVRQIESAHNLKPKHIAITGSTYLDELYKIYSQMLNTQAEHKQDSHNILDSQESPSKKAHSFYNQNQISDSKPHLALASECSEQTQYLESSQDLEHSNTAQQTQALKHSKLTQDSHLSQNPNLDSQSLEPTHNLALASHPSPRILVSPSWGKESLLSKYALKLLLPLAQSGLSLLIRPHPQSSISPSEASNLAYLKDALKAYKNVSWDSNVSNVPAFMYSDLMISDFSSVIFDYVCLQGKPVITIEDEMDLSGYDMADIPRDQIWTFKALKSIGKRIHPSEFNNLKEIILQIYKEYRGSQAKSKEKLDSGLDTEGDSTLESQNLDSKSSCVDPTSESKFKSETGLDSLTQTSHKQNLDSLIADSQNLDSYSSHHTSDSLAHNLSSIQKLLWQYPHNAGLQSALELLKIERELLQNALKPQARLVARYTELEGMIQSAQAKRSDLDTQSILDSQTQAKSESQSSLDSKVQSVSDAKPQSKSQTQASHKQKQESLTESFSFLRGRGLNVRERIVGLRQRCEVAPSPLNILHPDDASKVLPHRDNLIAKKSCLFAEENPESQSSYVDSGLDSQSISESKSPPEHQTPGTHSSIDQSTHCISNH